VRFARERVLSKQGYFAATPKPAEIIIPKREYKLTGEGLLRLMNLKPTLAFVLCASAFI
jgi:hypothetical protein